MRCAAPLRELAADRVGRRRARGVGRTLAGRRARAGRDAHVERIGNPAKLSYPADDKTFARNAWDLKAFAGRLYVGLGNRDNSEPAPNAGPVDVWFFALERGQFVKEGTLPDEQIETFRVIDGQLVIPGNDPMEPWELGNFYRLDPAGWTKIRTLPSGIHNFDMIKHGEAIYAALGSTYGAVVAASRDGGMTWQEHRLLPNSADYAARSHTFFVVDGLLHVSSTARPGGRIHVFADGAFRPQPGTDFFPGAPRRHLVVAMAASFGRAAVYLAAHRIPGKHFTPFGLFVASDARSVRAIDLPQEIVPRDIVVDGDRLLVLGTRKTGGSYENHVFETRDLVAWRDMFHFKTAAFARSFELLNGDFYFGLGSDNDDVRPETGDILRLAARHVGAR